MMSFRRALPVAVVLLGLLSPRAGLCQAPARSASRGVKNVKTAKSTSATKPAGDAAIHVAFIEGRPFAEILKKARAAKKPIMLDVVAAWCGPCKLMDRTTFADPQVVAFTDANVVAARVDAEKGEGRKLAARYAVRNFPTVLFVDGNGDELDRLLGAHPAANFTKYGSGILAGTSGVQAALARLKDSWSPADAAQLVSILAQRNDLERLRPLAKRILDDDLDLAQPGSADVLFTLAAVEDYREKVRPETADLLVTYMPRLTADPRYGMLGVILARELARRGDVAGTRATVEATLKVAGASSPVAADLYAARALAEKNAGKLEAAAAAYRTAITASANNAGLKASLQLDLADVLASTGKAAEARSNLEAGLEVASKDVTALTRATRVALKLKANADAVAHAQTAVRLSQGEDAAAQAALAAALSATGDRTGAAAAWRRAGEIEPDNTEYQKRLRELTKRPAAAKAS